MFRRPDDLLWKAILNDHFNDILRFVFPQAEQIFDFTKKIASLDKDLQKMLPDPWRKPNIRVVDTLAKKQRKDQTEHFVLCDVEVQGSNDKSLPKRMI
jgi:hypothetical protein